MSFGLGNTRPKLIFTFPGPARPQGAVYQRDRVSGGLGCGLWRWPVFLCCFIDQWREERDVPRYRCLIDVKDVGPYILNDVLPKISAGNDKRLPQSQFPRTSPSFIPWFFEQLGHAIF